MFESLDEDESEEKEPKETSYLGVIIFVCTLPVLFFFTHIGRTDLGLNIGISLAMNTLAVGICWDLRRRVWFWCVIVLILALHVPLVLRIQWPHVWVPKVALLPIGLADLLFTVGVVRFVEKFLVKSPSSR
jgi:hypothetical protein